MAILDELEQRGLIFDVTNREELAKLLAAGVVPLYAGYDPTSPSLHVGNLVPTILLKHFQRAGHKPIVLVGGATGMIGDPSGKSAERNFLDDTTLTANVAGIRAQLSRLLDFDDPVTGAVMTNNYEWTRDVGYLEFLRDMGRHLTINYMMAKDSVRNRIQTSPVLTIAASGAAPIRHTISKAITRLDHQPPRWINVIRDDNALVIMRGGGDEQLRLEPGATLELDGVTLSLERSSATGISYTEFSYMLLQAFDFVHLNRTHKCRLQVGGSDQFGNITAGCELMRRLEGPQLYGLVAPLLLDASGEKMGKTSTGERIWLDPERTIPYEFYQYWFNRSDEEVPRLLRFFSLRPVSEIEDVLRDHDRDRAKRIGQRELARAMTAWVHGEAAIANVERAQRVMFGESLQGMSDADLRVLVGIVKTVDVPRGELATGIGLVDLLARTLADSKGAARRLITQGGAYLNNVKVTDVDHKVTATDLATESMLVVGSGKREKCLVRVV